MSTSFSKKRLLIFIFLLVSSLQALVLLSYFLAKSNEFDIGELISQFLLGSNDVFLRIGFFFALVTINSFISLPGVMICLTVAAGFLWGPFNGSIIFLMCNFVALILVLALIRRSPFVSLLPQYSNFAIANSSGQSTLFWLFLLRVIPGIPTNIVNIAFAFTRLSSGKFLLVSLIGMLPGNIIFVIAGAELTQFESNNLLSLGNFLTLVLLGIAPFFARNLLNGMLRFGK